MTWVGLLLQLLVFDAILIIGAILLLLTLKRVKCASYAVMKRDFVGYFSNPTGYVFIGVFILFSTIAAFWPAEFFNANLATLDQLNKWFPLVMLIFIPAITMSVWSEERREGTDELLLTIPASDVDIVIGKYLASVAIFSVALFFSQLWNFKQLVELSQGDLDLGLFLSTYSGYWFMGLAMLALGMAASFLTSNLTVSFILGALVNAPLVFSNLFSGRAQSFSWWSYLSRFSDFGRGVYSLASMAFFILIAVAGVYMSIILIGRRHWQGGRDGRSMFGHYLIRGVAMIAVALGLSKFLSYHDYVRYDGSSAKVSSLSPDTKRILRSLDTKHPVVVEAFISKSVPEQYVETRVDLLNMLREFEALAGSNVQIQVHDQVDPFTKEAQLAEEKYGITAQTVMTQARGTIKQEELFMGAAFSCGLERVVIPFFDRGIPVEYELVRSITTAANARRLKIGVVKTGAQMFGGFDMQTFRQSPKQLIIQELEKQYEVEEVDLASPLNEGAYDVLLVVQPSSLTPPAMANLVTAIRNGQPAALFEDPYPAMVRGAPPTGQPNQPQGGGMFGQGRQPPQPKGDIRQLWSVLGIDMIGEAAPPNAMGMPGGGLYDARVVWQKYNPYENKVRVQQITPEWVFVSPDAPGAADDAFNGSDPVSSGLTQLLLMCPGGLRELGTRKLEFTPLIMTGDESGEISFEDLSRNQGNSMALSYVRKLTKKRYIVGARIRGKIGDQFKMGDGGSPLILGQVSGPQVPTGEPNQDTGGPDEKKDGSGESKSDADGDEREKEIHVIYVCDIDLLSSEFMAIRAQPDDQVKWEFDNVTFVLNVLDSLAGDNELIEIRKRKTRHSTLKLITQQTDEARGAFLDEIAGFGESFENAEKEAQDRMNERIKPAQDKLKELGERAASGEQVSRREIIQARQEERRIVTQEQTKLDRQLDKLRRERDRSLKRIEREMELKIRDVQNEAKVKPVILPPIILLLVGALVWIFRRAREREGIAAVRRR